MKSYNATHAERAKILLSYNLTERLCREDERKRITGISRSQAWKLEQNNEFPHRIRIAIRTTVWRLSDLLIWVELNSNKNIGGSSYE